MSGEKPRGAGGDETVDPTTSVQLDRPASAEVTYLEVVAHADARMIGARALLGSRVGGGTNAPRPIVVGRDEPLFAHDDGRPAGPLADPCVSRKQLDVHWLRDAQVFRVARDSTSRRALTLVRVEAGQRVEVPWPEDGRVRPGTLISIGDRVLLRLDCGPMPDASSLGIVGGGRAIHDLRRRILALTRASSVLVLGETGSGKELVARALHEVGPRRGFPFLPLNCAAVPDTLIEAELFGFEKGTFSNATASRDGLLRAAGAGTVFLDEIGDLSLAAQAKLLRVLQERRVRPLGSPNEAPFEAAIVMATHRDLQADVAAGSFRADLYARIEAPSLAIPPLRERKEDVPRLFARFLASELEGESIDDTPFRAADARPPLITVDAMLRMMSYDWPRNVREVGKVAARVATELRARGVVAEDVYPRTNPSAAVARPSDPLGKRPATTDAPPTAEELLEVLDQHDFVQSRAAKALSVSRTTLDKWMRERGVRRPSDVTREEVVDALARHDGEIERAARDLRISSRGLRLRTRELGLGD